MTHFVSKRRQTGIGLFGILFWGVILAFVALLCIQVLPTLNEYFTIQRAVKKAIAEAPDSEPGIRQAFTRQKDIEYSISSIDAKDLEITRSSDGGMQVSFAYDKKIPIVPPVYLLIQYRGKAH